MTRWDSYLLWLCNQNLANPLLDGLMVAITYAAMPLLAILPCVLLLARRKRAGLALLATLAFSTLLAVGVQFLLMRPRPVGVRLVLPMPDFPSFPSGHAAGAFGCAMFATLVWRRARLLALPGAVLISLSRVYLGHHYPTDAIGGGMLGVAVAIIVYGLFYRPRVTGRPRWAWLLWAQVAVMLLATLSAYLGLLSFDFLAFAGADKVFHFLLFGGLAFLSVGWWARQRGAAVLAALGLLTLVEEGLQVFSSVRCFDLLDLASSLAGVALFGWLATVVRRAGWWGAGRWRGE